MLLPQLDALLHRLRGGIDPDATSQADVVSQFTPNPLFQVVGGCEDADLEAFLASIEIQLQGHGPHRVETAEKSVGTDLVSSQLHDEETLSGWQQRIAMLEGEAAGLQCVCQMITLHPTFFWVFSCCVRACPPGIEALHYSQLDCEKAKAELTTGAPSGDSDPLLVLSPAHFLCLFCLILL